MSNEIAILDSSLPDYLRTGELDSTTKALMGGGGGGASTKRISIRGGVWRMLVNGKEVAKNEERSMNVVIVAAAPKVSRSFYSKQYQEGGETISPDCWSANGDVPDAKAANPQASRCVDCPMNMQGSGQNGTRACRFSQRLAVVLANDLEGDVMQLTLPATSIFGEGKVGKWPLQAYAKILGAKGVPVTAVVTEMRFDTESATPRIMFKAVGFLNSAQHEISIRQGASEAAKRAITMTVAESDGVKTKALPAPKVEAAPVPAPEAAEQGPTKRAAKKEPATDKADLSKILSDWDG
jgi:hypothetical protein